MSMPARRIESDARPEDALVRAVGEWVAMLSRTLKTCRLHDAANPAVLRQREALAQAACTLVAAHGELTLRFEATDVTFAGSSLHPARSREDNLAYPFHRDGVRALTLRPGIEPSEVERLVDCVLAASGPALEGDDLVTLLWEAQFPHLDIDYLAALGVSAIWITPVFEQIDGVRDDDGRLAVRLGTMYCGDRISTLISSSPVQFRRSEVLSFRRV